MQKICDFMTFESFLGNTRKKTKEKKKPPSKSPLKAKCWVLTINNFVTSDIVEIEDFFVKHIIGKECCPSTGTKHLQVYGECLKQTYLTVLKRHFPRAHIEVAKGSRKDNFRYCSKEGDFISNFPPADETFLQFFRRIGFGIPDA